ncbi:2-hydroxyacid dehydrogenase [Pedobacter kyungheensis]|uniref:2-hydroxyacid dehydrogenase n=1 Tax=Pedobacter kyungheensis TaxID=1069985 RepID=A0A0C1FU84_9SPHI|nr:2-hydroxyacid dehydrogenase [Pedobacter kyungheensis]KIA95393.1 2-hydroxyacid dehydrogenase [Pedobacter kyungheensis]
MKIAVFSTCSYDEEFLEKYNTDHELIFFKQALDYDNLSLTKGCDAVCLFVNDQANGQILSALAENGVKLILLRCAGFNNVDLEVAEELGISILRVPAYSPEAVAEHAIAMIMTLNRKTHKAYNRIREGNFSLEGLMGFNLHSSKVALIGTGNIGKVMYRILKGFGCQISAYDPYPDLELRSDGLKYASLEEVLKDADIVTLHCPLTEQSFHMINGQTLRYFKKGAMLINTSRGALIQTSAVITSLKSGGLGSLGLDVYEQESGLFFRNLSEKVIQDDLIARLISFPNVLISSHQGFFTREAMRQIAETTFSNADAYVSGKILVNEIKP